MVEEERCPHCGALLVNGVCPNCGSTDVSVADWLEYLGVSENDGFARGIIESEDEKVISVDDSAAQETQEGEKTNPNSDLYDKIIDLTGRIRQLKEAGVDVGEMEMRLLELDSLLHSGSLDMAESEAAYISGRLKERETELISARNAVNRAEQAVQTALKDAVDTGLATEFLRKAESALAKGELKKAVRMALHASKEARRALEKSRSWSVEVEDYLDK